MPEQENASPEVKIVIPERYIAIVLNSLADKPYRQVAELMSIIREQLPKQEKP